MRNLFDAFISYGRADSKAFATKLHSRLLEESLKVWFDQNDIPLGVDFQNQIDDGIEKADNFLYIIAPHSINSPYCGKEIDLALKRNKRIIPLLHVEQISQETWQQRYPNGTAEDWEAYKSKGLHTSFQNMHPAIGKINWVYFREGIDDFETSFTGLISLIRKQADYVEQHTRFLTKALDWERNQKQTSYLLVGEERIQAESWLKIRFKDEQPPCQPTDLHCEFIGESTKNANNLLTQVFLSHSDTDRAILEKVAKSLRREAFTIWTNRTDIKTGTEFQNEINQGIEGADNLVYLISPDSIQSKYCQDELSLAFGNKKRIIPLLIEPTELEEIPPHIRALQFIDFTNSQDEASYQACIDKLINQLKQDAHYYEQHKVLLVKALKWERQNRNPSILLRGYDLQQSEAWLKVAKQRREHPPLPLHEEFITESLNQPTDSSLEVFVSYSRADSDFARKLNEALQIQGKTTWFDQESIASGSDFQQEIYRGIENSDNFVFIISPKSVNSPYCADEVEYAQKLNKRFVTILHREISPQELHPALASVQWIDFKKHDGDFYANFSELVRTLDTDREHVKSHTKWSQRALEWEQKDKSSDLLLRGSEFLIAQNWLQEAEQQKKNPAAAPLQKEYILKSQEAIEAAIAREKRQALILKSLLGLVSAGFLVAIGVSVFAFIQWKRADIAQEAQVNSVSRFSLTLSETEQKFDALIEAIRAQKEMQDLDTVEPETRSLLLTALQAAVYEDGFRESERDRLTKHTSTVYSASFSPDGKTIATASGDGTVKLWSPNGQELRTLNAGNYSVYSVSFSPDSKTLATANGDKTVKLWNKQGKLLETLTGHKDIVWSAIWSRDGNTIASASADNTVKLWSKQGKLLQTLTGHQKSVRSVSFNPDGNTLASASEDKTVKLWNKQGKLLQTLTGHKKAVRSVRFSSDGNIIATGSADKTVNLWSKQGKLLQTLRGHTEPVNSVRFSLDGKTIATAGDDDTIKLWSKDGKLLQTLKGHAAPVWSLSFSPDGNTLASASTDNTAKLWSKSEKVLQTLQGHQGQVWSVVWSPDGNTLATAGEDKTIKLWNKQKQLLQTFKAHEEPISSIAFSPDGKQVVSGSDDQTVKLWSKDGTFLQTLKGHDAPVWSVDWNADGNIIASSSADKTIKLWNKDGTRRQTLIGHEGTVRSVVWSPDGNTLASGSSDKTIKLWNKEGKLLQTLIGHTDEVTSVSFTPNGNTIASTSADNTVKLWSKQGKLLNTFFGHKDRVFGVAFNPNGNIIASASGDKTIKLWSTEGKPLQTLIGHRELVSSIRFSPDGKTLASASNDKTVILWNLADLQLDKLMGDACAQVGNYLKYNAPPSDRHLCDGIKTQ
jgi:WD40 repeat protein